MDTTQPYSQSECAKYFRRYERKEGNNVFRVIQGWELPDGRLKTMEGNVVEIPSEYKKVRIDKKWLLSTICPVPLDMKKIHKEKALSASDWINKASAKHGLTIGFVKKLKVGEKVTVLMLDRNVLDGVPYNQNGKVFSPAPFFKNNKTTFIYQGDMKMRLNWFGTPTDMEFDVEYRKGNWYPLNDGVLPAKDTQGLFTLFGQDTKWTEFPTKTKVGVRGPMILWSHVKDLPKVYYGENPW